MIFEPIFFTLGTVYLMIQLVKEIKSSIRKGGKIK